MKIKEFIKMETDIDVYDDVCEELAIAFCGPLELTDKGREVFADVLDYEITVDEPNCTAIVSVDDQDDAVWKERLRHAERFFYAAAGYCAAIDYNEWFREGGE